MQSLWSSIVAWFQSKGGFAHVIAAVYLAIVAAYAGVPAFHDLVLAVYHASPAWLDQVLAAGVGLLAFYFNPTKASK